MVCTPPGSFIIEVAKIFPAERGGLDYKNFADSALLDQIARRQEHALGELYDRYGRLVFSLALNIVGDQATAEEITQDVFYRVWTKAETYRVEQAKVSTWLTSITRHRAIDVLRYRNVRPDASSLAWADAPPNLAPANESRLEEVAELNFERRRIRQAVAELPAEQRLVLALAYFHGLTQREIAAQLDQPLGTVKTRIRLGMQKLRQALQE